MKLVKTTVFMSDGYYCISFTEAGDDVELYFYKGSTNSQKLLLNRLPCSCQSYTCGCCAGMNIQSYNFSQNGKSFTQKLESGLIQLAITAHASSSYIHHHQYQ
jgi:hypothetical protein